MKNSSSWNRTGIQFKGQGSQSPDQASGKTSRYADYQGFKKKKLGNLALHPAGGPEHADFPFAFKDGHPHCAGHCRQGKEEKYADEDGEKPAVLFRILDDGFCVILPTAEYQSETGKPVPVCIDG